MTECMDNFLVKVQGRLPETLRAAVALAMSRHRKAVAWRVQANELMLYWDDSGPGLTPLPVSLDADGAVVLVERWLAANAPNDPRPDIDGSVSRGFLIEAAERHGIFRVRPIWAERHK